MVKYRTDVSLDVAEGEYTPEALSELAGSFPILDILKGIDSYTDRSYHVVDPDYFTGLQAVFTEENVPLIRDWLTIDAAMYMISLLDEEAALQLMAINVASMGGGEINADLSAFSTMSDLLPVPLDNLYIRAATSEHH